MLFNSYEFLFGFLPLTLLAFYAVGRYSMRLAAATLTAASLCFYAWWDARYVVLLLLSISANYAAGVVTARANAKDLRRVAFFATFVGVAFDLGLLGYYKYANFFMGNLNDLTGGHVSIGAAVLPLGISFFTFTQIAFLVDTYRRIAREYNPVHYALFVTFFPHLIAGPILHHKEMMPQFGRAENYRPHAENFAVGFTIFCIGLAKKTVLADGIGPFANDVFASAARGDAPTLLYAWGGALAYTLQLYFDFSGYSDMAIGLARLFGITFPLNFNSPYKAVNIIEF